MGSYSAQLHHTRPSVSCSTLGHPTHGVWPHTYLTGLGFLCQGDYFGEKGNIKIKKMTGFNIKEESYIYESILFGFPGSRDEAIAINYCMLYAKHYIYLEKLKEENKKQNLT